MTFLHLSFISYLYMFFQATPFIQTENIEKAIEEALANPFDPNFAIDLDGYVYRGRETSIGKIPEEARERMSSI